MTRFEDFLKQMNGFIEHNIKLGYISPETTVEELLKFTEGVKNNYLPMIKEIKNFAETERRD